jgi:hypothetical protein
MKNSKLIVALSLALIAPHSSAYEYSVLFDKDMSPYAGSSINQSLFNVYKELDDYYLPSSEDKLGFLWGTARFGKFILEDLFASYLTVYQHEVFGHGYRAREFDFKHVSYKVNIASGYTAYSLFDFNKLHTNQKAALSSGGMEANTILSQQIRSNWFLDQKLDHRDAIFYLKNQMTALNYVYSTAGKKWDTFDGNDVRSYINHVNTWYGATGGPLNLGKLRGQVLWNLLDLPLYNSYYALWQYVVCGDQNVDLFMFDVKGYKYLPSGNLLFAPWGTEFQIQNNIITPKNQFITANVRYGSNSFINSFGIDLAIKPILSYKNFEFGNRLFLWRQPHMIISPSAQGANNRFGIADYVSIDYKWTKNISVISEIGYKTAGFILGDPLANSYIVRLGLKYNFVPPVKPQPKLIENCPAA